MSILKIGDVVWWRGTWGAEPPKQATINRIEKTEFYRSKYGEEVNEVNWNDNFVVILDNGHWAYNFQLQPLTVSVLM